MLFSLLLLANSSLPNTVINDCYNGDTCTTINGGKIRLAYIDNQELKGKKTNPIEAEKAKLFLDDLNIQKLILEKGYGKIYERYSYQFEWTL